MYTRYKADKQKQKNIVYNKIYTLLALIILTVVFIAL